MMIASLSRYARERAQRGTVKARECRPMLASWSMLHVSIIEPLQPNAQSRSRLSTTIATFGATFGAAESEWPGVFRSSMPN